MLNVGEILAGKYRVDKVLGIGGMGIVVAATHLELEQRVAIKFMLSAALTNATAAERFLREARAVVKLRSEHVCRVLDVGRLESTAPFIVMELLEGADLAQLLARSAPLALTDTVEYMMQALGGIAEAHANGIIHRDLKPANLFVTTQTDGSPLVKVLDFGISKSGAAASVTRTGDVMGSPGYMAPEQMVSAKDIDARADIWAVGTILYECVTGRLPFAAETLPALMLRVMNGAPDPIAAVRPDLPPAFGSVVMRCLARAPAARFADVAELAAALAPWGSASAQVLAAKIARVLQRASTAGAARHPAGARPSPAAPWPGAPTVVPAAYGASAMAPPAGPYAHAAPSPAIGPLSDGAQTTLSSSAAGRPSEPGHRSRKGWIAGGLGLAAAGAIAAIVLAIPSGEHATGDAHGSSEATVTAAATPAAVTLAATPPVPTPTFPERTAPATPEAPPQPAASGDAPPSTPPPEPIRPEEPARPEAAGKPRATTKQESAAAKDARRKRERTDAGGAAKPAGSAAKPAGGAGQGSDETPPVEEIPQRLDREMIAQGIARVRAGLVACGDELEVRGPVAIRARVAPDGSVVEVTAGAADRALSQCIEKRIRAAKFAQTREGGRFTLPLHL